MATDTMKNTVYSLAKQTSSKVLSMEDFAKELVNFILKRSPQTIYSCEVTIASKQWENIKTDDGIVHPTAFVKTTNEQQLTVVKRAQNGQFLIVSGLENLTVMKTAKSSFSNFVRDSLTTLPEAEDRLFGTAIRALWTYDAKTTTEFDKLRKQIRNIIMNEFARHESKSVQHTLYDISKMLLEKISEIRKIDITMPNIHCLLVDLSRFGQDNNNEIFMPIDDPHGLIQCSLKRGDNFLSKL